MNATLVPRVVTPESAHDAAGVLAAAARDDAAIVIAGGSTLQSIGNAPRRCDVMLHTAGLAGIRDYEPADMTAGLLAGTTLAEVARVLGEHGQWIPFDAPLAARATVGGTLGAGWAGPRRAVYGRPRDLVIGSTVALTDGSLAHAGGMVVKNVAGYDMSKLYIGSLGTLGLIVRANFKALPRPAVHRLAIAAVADDVRDRTLAALGELAIEPSAALMLDGFHGVAAAGGAPLRLLLTFEGSAAVVERGTHGLRAALGKAGIPETLLLDGDDAQRTLAAVIDAYIDVPGPSSLTYRAPGLPSSAWSRTRLAGILAHEHGLTLESIADVRTGDAILRLSSHSVEKFADALPAFDAALHAAFERVTVLAGTPELRATIDAWGPPPANIETMRAIKARFDPTGILAPGRYVGAL